MTSNRKRISGLLGGAIGLVGLGFVVRLVLRERETIADLVADGNPVWFLVAVAAGLAGMTGIGLTWGVIVRDLDQSLSLPQTLRAYFVGQLGKYVPGGVWAVMGRGEWASRAGVPRAAGYTSTVLSIVTTYLAASALAGVAIVIGARPDSWLLPGAIALLAPVGIVCLHPAILRVGLRTMGRLRSSLNDLQPMPWLSSFGYVLRQLPSWVLITVATGAVAFIGLARALVRVALFEIGREEMDITERQALQHRKRFVESHPDSTEAAAIAEQIEKDQQRWNTLQRDRSIRAARRALERNQPRVAYVLAERALHYHSEDSEASALSKEALARIERWRDEREAANYNLQFKQLATAQGAPYLGGGERYQGQMERAVVDTNRSEQMGNVLEPIAFFDAGRARRA